MPLLPITQEIDLSRLTGEELRVAKSIARAGKKGERVVSLERLLARRNARSTSDDGVVTSIDATITE